MQQWIEWGLMQAEQPEVVVQLLQLARTCSPLTAATAPAFRVPTRVVRAGWCERAGVNGSREKGVASPRPSARARRVHDARRPSHALERPACRTSSAALQACCSGMQPCSGSDFPNGSRSRSRGTSTAS